MSLGISDPDSDLMRSGFIILGNVDLKLIENIQPYLQSKFVVHRGVRWSKLLWSFHCDAIFRDFEAVSTE